MTGVSIVFVTTGSEEDALRIGRTVVEERLAACAGIVPRIVSVYRWKGEIHQEPESLMVMKTRSAMVPELRERVRELHGYEVPEFVAFPVEQGLPEYLAWVLESTDRSA